MSAFAGIPCARCGETDWKDQHNVGQSHYFRYAYVPDERSVEWAAVRLHEALDIASAYLTATASMLPRDTADCHVKQVHGDVETCRQALALADAAGIGGNDK